MIYSEQIDNYYYSVQNLNIVTRQALIKKIEGKKLSSDEKTELEKFHQAILNPTPLKEKL